MHERKTSLMYIDLPQSQSFLIDESYSIIQKKGIAQRTHQLGTTHTPES